MIILIRRERIIIEGCDFESQGRLSGLVALIVRAKGPRLFIAVLELHSVCCDFDPKPHFARRTLRRDAQAQLLRGAKREAALPVFTADEPTHPNIYDKKSIFPKLSEFRVTKKIRH